MPLYIYQGRDSERGLELRKLHRESHLAHLSGLDKAGRIRFAGPLIDAQQNPCGSLIVFEAENLEAAQAIARQLRLRNLGGIIIIDFIDMNRAEHQDAVLAELRKQLARDRVKMTVSGFTQLGLVEMTRKRTRESLAHMLCEPCPTCGGKGSVKTARSVCYDILREILREARQFNPKEFRVIASAAVIEMLLDEESQHLAGLSDFIGKPISLQAEATMSPEQYDIVLM